MKAGELNDPPAQGQIGKIGLGAILENIVDLKSSRTITLLYAKIVAKLYICPFGELEEKTVLFFCVYIFLNHKL